MQSGGAEARRGFTAVELVVVIVVLGTGIGVAMWWLSERQRAQLVSDAIGSPGTVFGFECRYVAEPSETESIMCTVSNATAFDLPLMYRANSFFEQREGESYDGLPITTYPARDVDPITGEFRSMISAGVSIEFGLFSEFPMRTLPLTVVMKPPRPLVGITQAGGVQNVQVGGSLRIRGSHEPIRQSEIRRLYFDERDLVFQFTGD